MSKPTARELIANLADHREDPDDQSESPAWTRNYWILSKRVEAVLALHVRIEGKPGNPHMEVDYCCQDGDAWPCETVRVLDGEEAQ